MDRSYPSALRIQQRIRLRRRVAVVLFALSAAGALAFAMAANGAASPDAAAPATATVATASSVGHTAQAGRRVYRYSVVPGGAANAAELARVVRSDKAVAAHYAGFDVAQARPVTVAAPRAVYVSYRKGDDIYWTAKKVRLQVGETLLSDGRSEMRARCANRISDLPRLPVEKHPPRLAALDALEGEIDDGEGGIAYVSAPDLDEAGDLPELAGQSFHLAWPDGATPNPGGEPGTARTPFAIEPLPGLAWPPMTGNRSPGVPPQSGAMPGAPVLAFAAPPPVSGALPVQADPLPMPAPDQPSQPVPDASPLIPRPDPSQPGPPFNPALDLPQPADVPEPATAWLFGAALVAMLRPGKKR